MLGYLLKERPQKTYHLEITHDGFAFKIKKDLYRYFFEFITRGDIRSHFLLIPKTTSGDTVTLNISLPFITFPNLEHRKTDWRKLQKCAEQISLLFHLLNMGIESGETPDFFFGDELQLMTIATSYRRDTHFHACAIGVGFSKKARELLSKKYPSGARISECEKISAEHFYGLSLSRKNEFDRKINSNKNYGGRHNSINVSVRNGGVPHFIVPGDCACLGTNPDQFKHDGELNSHNLDTTLQQMAMLASLISFWNKVLMPLYEESKLV